MFLPNPGILAAGVVVGKTRAEFDAYLVTLGTPVTAAAQVYGTGGFYFNYADDASVGYGSAWRPGFDQGMCAGSFDKIAAHCFPSQLVREAQVGKRVFVEISSWFDFEASLGSFARNGVSTSSAGVPAFGQSGNRFYYYDDALGPLQVNPQTGTGPSPLTWT